MKVPGRIALNVEIFTIVNILRYYQVFPDFLCMLKITYFNNLPAATKIQHLNIL